MGETKASQSKESFSHKLEAKFNKLKRKHGVPFLSYLNNDERVREIRIGLRIAFLSTNEKKLMGI